MRINIVGGGPSGLYFAWLMKKTWPAYRIRVIEQNAAGDTYGFGVVLSGRALNFLADADPGLVAALMSHMQTWSDQHIVLNGHRIIIDGSSYSSISRLALLNQLHMLCRSIGVEIEFHNRISGLSQISDCEIIVGADGAKSIIRDSCREEFGTQTIELKNYFAWYGVRQPYPAHTLTFISRLEGVYCGHHYRYTPQMSTFVAEVDAATWTRAGLDMMSDDARRIVMENVFSKTLGGATLIENHSVWRRYRITTNQRWHHRNIVLTGDALRTAHPSIGSGTRLAIEDSIALWRAFQSEGTNVNAVFRRYQAEREPIRDKLKRAAERSIAWYESMADKMAMHPVDFAHDYMMRTGIMNAERLARDCPAFMSAYASHISSRV